MPRPRRPPLDALDVTSRGRRRRIGARGGLCSLCSFRREVVGGESGTRGGPPASFVIPRRQGGVAGTFTASPALTPLTLLVFTPESGPELSPTGAARMSGLPGRDRRQEPPPPGE